MTVDLAAVWSFLVSIWTELLIVLIVIGLRVVGVDFYPKLLLAFDWTRTVLRRGVGRQRLILYTDVDDAGTTRINLTEALSDVLGPHRISVIGLRNPEEILRYHLHPAQTRGVAILLTDVTMLSTNRRIRQKIQTKLLRYAQNGGMLMLGHDTLYRRSRNHLLQNLAGGSLEEFRPIAEPDNGTPRPGVQYRLNRAAAGELGGEFAELFEELPENPLLDDGEYVTGTWNEDVLWLYTTEKPLDDGSTITIPTLTYRPAGRGAVCWLHSGDHKANGGPLPISKPDENFLAILRALLLYARPRHGWRAKRLAKQRQAQEEQTAR
ncbi:hypothetical protein [Nesterenkonia ebinurensis]|uniref:hypothetical protein n=1 Tax=Nesterenkonia ebinurensis TaxID=2608252 RepID=UPI00123DEEDE|nr:hypothetical protein [Nesterenkonia ebinurensis]